MKKVQSHNGSRGKTPLGPILIYIALVAGIGISMYWYYGQQRDLITIEKQNDLTPIAGLKVYQIASWRNERISDAQFVMSNPILCSSIEQ